MKSLYKALEGNLIFKSVVNAIADGLLIVNKKGDFIFWNKAANQFVRQGLDKPARLYDLFTEDLARLCTDEETPLNKALNENFEDYRVCIKNDIYPEGRLLSCNGQPIINDNDILVGAVVTFRDITQFISNEKKILREKLFYEKILNYIPALIYSKDLTGKYIYTNRAFDKFVKSPNPTGKTAFDLFKPEDAAKLLLHDEEVLLAQKSKEFSEKGINDDGQEHFFTDFRFPIKDEEQNIYALGGICHDITEKVENDRNQEEQRLKGAVITKMAAIGMLSAEIGHEINNPLAIIKTSTTILKMHMEGEEIPKEVLSSNIKMIEDTIVRITNIVDALRNTSRDNTSDSPGTYPLDEIIKDVISLSEVKTKSKSVNLITELDPRILSKSISCLRVQLTEVFINLISNACDAIETRINPWIKMTLTEDDRKILVKVSDSGEGIPLEIRNKIFQPFFTTKELGKGTGLGLSICKNLMKKQNGDVYLEPGSANCFVVAISKVK